MGNSLVASACPNSLRAWTLIYDCEAAKVGLLQLENFNRSQNSFYPKFA